MHNNFLCPNSICLSLTPRSYNMHSKLLKFQNFGFYLLPAILVLSGCVSKKTSVVWDQSFQIIGSQSSPRVTDLNADGIDDVIMGACKNEYQPTEEGVIALDGATGHTIWVSDAPDQVYGSATLVDITGDQTLDVVIGGRWAYLRALNGKTGETIWNYNSPDSTDPILKYAKYNFYNSVLVPDQNEDGIRDLLIQNGGNHKSKPHSSIDRYPGVLMLMDNKSGGILAADTMPDGEESYMSPLYFEQPDANQWILFGTGGETMSGHLYIASLSDLKNRSLSKARILATDSSGHGFIAPPVLADINKDGFYDIIAISHSSRIFAIDGKTLTLLWTNRIPGTESSNSFVVGQFTPDEIPDFFTFVSQGEWPQSTGSLQILLDGKDGRLVYQDSLGCTGFSSPVAYDLTHDGSDEALISINEYDCSRGFTDQSELKISNRLLAIDFKNHRVQTIAQHEGFKNIFSTPWIGDLDHDGYLDIIYSRYFSPGPDLLWFMGMQIKRISTSIKIRKEVKWGGYMGSSGDGIYK